MVDITKSRAVLIGAGNFPKDNELQANQAVYDDVRELMAALSDEQVLGLPHASITTLIDTADNTRIKEELAQTVEQAEQSVIIYYNGHIVVRKSQIYFATVNSTLQQAHVNGISLADVITIVRESEAKHKIFIFDAAYHKVLTEGAPDIDQLISDIFEGLRREYPEMIFLSAANTAEAQFTKQLIEVLRSGIEVEKNSLTLNDIYEVVAEKYKDKNLNFKILKNGISRSTAVSFSKNRRYNEFLNFKKDGDVFFEEESFEKALPYYSKATSLFPQNEQVGSRLKFINLLLEARAAFEKEAYQDAKATYEQAQKIIDLHIVQKGIKSAIEKIANQFYDAEDYPNAKTYYEILVKTDKENHFYKQRYDICLDEIKFAEYVDQADRLYFVDDYAGALELYNQAIKINKDHKISRRKEECEKFLAKEKVIREKIETEIRKQISDEVKAQALQDAKVSNEEFVGKLEEERKQLRSQLLAELRPQIAAEVKAELDEAFWSRIAILNSAEAYELYISFFNDGKYLQKAQKRAEELKERTQINEAKNGNNGHLNGDTQRIKLSEILKTQGEPRQDDEAEEASEKTGEAIRNVIKQIEADMQEETQPSALEELFQQDTLTKENPIEENIEEESFVAKNNQQKEELNEEQTSFAKEENIEPQIVTPAATHTIKPDVSTMDEDQLWAYAQSQNTEEAYNLYIDNTKKYRYLADAYRIIGRLGKSSAASSSPATDESPKVTSQEAPAPTITAKEVAKETNLSFETMSDEELWEYASKTHTVESYMIYIENTKTSAHISDAYGNINDLNHPTLYDKSDKGRISVASSNGSASSHEKLAHTTSNSTIATSPIIEKPKSTAFNSGDEEFEDSLWAKASEENTISAYFHYLNSTVKKKYWDDAKQRINSLKNDSQAREQQDWVQAQITDTVEAYKDYIRKYPLGNYYAKAMFRLNKLESEINQ